MGLLKHLLFWPVTGPRFLIDFSLRQVEGVVREELTDDNSVKAELMELQLLLELGDIDDAEYARREAELMLRLREIRDWRERLGMGVSGGLVRVAGSGGHAPEPDAAAGEESAATGSDAPSPDADSPDADSPDADLPDADSPTGPPRVAEPGGASIDVHLDWDE